MENGPSDHHHMRLSAMGLILSLDCQHRKYFCIQNIEIILLKISIWEKIPMDFLTFPARDSA